MFSVIFRFLENVFLIPEEKGEFKKIFLDKTAYYKSGFEDFALDKVFIACEYETNLQKILKKFKYQYNKKSLEKLVLNYEELIFKFIIKDYDPKDIIITGVPMFYINRVLRGYNQTYMIGKFLSKKFGFKFAEIIDKNKYTKRQALLSKDDRIKNLNNCFKLNSKYNETIQGKIILLIDDVISTGTTANEVSKILKSAGAKEVVGLFLATGK